MYDNPFGYGFFPPEPPPPPGLPELKKALKAAVRADDVKETRRVFETAFWHGIELVPDWHDLLVATLCGDKQLLRLLVAHGARWSNDETLSLKEIYAGRWNEITATLRAAGLRVDGVSGHASVVQTMQMQHALKNAAAKDPAPLNTGKTEFEQEYHLSNAITKCLATLDVKAAAQLLLLRHPTGDVSIQNEVWMAMIEGGQNRMLEAIDALAALPGIRIHPLQLDARAMATSPGLVGALSRRNLLDYNQPHRLALVEGWVKQPNSALDYKRAALSLFTSSNPVSDSEADAFIALYKTTFAEHPGAMSLVSARLQETAFFTGPAWTRERLEKLSLATPENHALKTIFNSRLAAGRFGNMSAADITKPDNFTAFLAAHEQGIYQATSRQSLDIIDELHRRLTVGAMSHDHVRNVLKKMKDGGARFGMGFQISEWTSAYFGKNEPGMIKILLDLGIVRAENVDMVAVGKKAGFNAREHDKIYWSDPANPWQQFYIQLYLERQMPAVYVPLRGKVASYREAFREAFFKDKIPPKPPKPPGPGGWFR